MKGFAYHFWLTLRLNFRQPQALVYGYAVPVLFLIAFAAVFRGAKPPLVHQMCQLVTISALGGACFGLPTALVAERERGWWRRYRLLPRAAAPLLSGTLAARFVLIASAGLLQIVLAWVLCRTPLPAHPALFCAAYVCVAAAFLGLGLLIAALADTVPAVQALGQCVFLPLIMIGGVGIPLIALPLWAQRVASFFPGRYAVEALDAGYSGTRGPLPLRMDAAALLVIGAAAGLAGACLFRWDSGERALRRGAAKTAAWLAAAALPWLTAGVIAVGSGDWRVVKPAADAAAEITDAQIRSITYDNLPADESVVTPLAPASAGFDGEEKARLDELASKLASWPPAQDPDSAQAIRSIVSVASIADVSQDPQEAAIARTVVNFLFAHYRQDKLERGLAWIVLEPAEGKVPTTAPELGLPGEVDEREIRVRDAIYAQKFLGRVRGRINY